MTPFDLIVEKKACYELPGFQPLSVDAAFLQARGIDYPLDDAVHTALIAGSDLFATLFANRALIPEKGYTEALANVEQELEVHNYTGICPTNVMEVTPSSGSCAVACQYCLVTDGSHCKPITVYTNYSDKLRPSLERNRGRQLFYYFSPKTEAFSEPHLYNGIAHDVLRTFIDHYRQFPDSSIRIFIASKAGPAHLSVKHQGESLFDLMAQIPTKIQYNGSIGIMPGYLRDVLEPNAASIEERLEVLVRCRESGIWAESVLCQPLILPYLTEENVHTYCRQLQQAGVKNIKPEFLTTEVRNLVLFAQFINYYNPELLGEFFYPYLHAHNLGHIKQRSRLAPDKTVCVEKLDMMRRIADEYGITISICNWVKRELGQAAEWVLSVDTASSSNGYRCLGYQTRLFTQ